jgi:hypothetical protein
MRCGHYSVEILRSNFQEFIFLKPPSRFPDNGEGPRQNFQQRFLKNFVSFLFEFINLLE